MKSSSKLTRLFAAFVLFTTAQTLANEQTNQDQPQQTLKINPIAFIGYSFGGDDVGSLTYEEGGTSDVTSGGGFTLGGGLDLFNAEYAMGVELTGAYKFDSAVASNADVTFDRFEFSAMPYYQINDTTRFGLGITQHTGVELSTEFDRNNSSDKFNSALGFFAQVSFKVSEQLYVSGRYTSIDYETDPITFYGYGYQYKYQLEVDGSSIGLFMTYVIANEV